MRRVVNNFGFSLIEMMVVVAVILILAGALLGVGKYIKIRAEIDLTRSGLEVLVTALQQYYDDLGDFPFDTDIDDDGDSYDGTGAFEYLQVDMLDDLDDNPTDGLLPSISSGVFVDDYASSTALYYFLNKSPNSRKIAESLMDTLISSKDADGNALKISINSDPEIDLPRFIDPWGISIRYEYIDGTAFPIVTSAGPDMKFGTPDDVTSQ